jgi:hypothetical protein
MLLGPFFCDKNNEKFPPKKHSFNFPKFQQLGNKYAKYTFCCVFVIVTQIFGTVNKISQLESLILNNFGKYR